MKAEELLRIGELFTQLGWPVETDESGPVPDVFERFSRMCARLSQDQRDLILTITQDYIWLNSAAERESRFLASWKKMVPQLPLGIQLVGLAPLLKPKSSRPKSSDVVFSTARGFQRNLIRSLEHRKLIFGKSAAELAKYLSEFDNTALVLVDDYLGSGNTASSALDSLNLPIRNSGKFPYVVVLTLAAQQNAVSRLADRCLVVADLLLKRGISDKSGIDTEQALAVMKSIGARLGIEKSIRLGYGAAEALTTLQRTPNNTFPVYWTNKKVKGSTWDSPFTRYKDKERGT